jgi:hypothetical protein
MDKGTHKNEEELRKETTRKTKICIYEKKILKWILEIPVAWYRDKWRALARAVMNLRVLQNCWQIATERLAACKNGLSSIQSVS